MTTRLLVIRDVILLGLGTAGVIHQEFFRAEPNGTLLMFYAAIFGLTAFLPGGIADMLRANRELPVANAPAPPAPLPAPAPPAPEVPDAPAP